MIVTACSETAKPTTASTDLSTVSPALQRYDDQVVQGDLWNRPGLSPRDRSVVTLSALITNNQTTDLPRYVERALDNGVTHAELSEVITHLGFYAGWPNAMGAVAVARGVFAQRGIRADQLPQATPELLPLDESAEAARQSSVEQNYGAVAPGVLQYTTDVVFRDLWLRPGLSPRDRSLVTVSALVASGQVPQITYHLGRAMDNGLTQEQASEALTQLAFYAGWPKVFSALPVVKDVFASRPA
jgi:4-carboxymuconolactone decarboxylase